MLFLSDLDGTLMDSSGNVAEEDVECIHQWTQKHAFGFVTGRDRAFCLALASKYQLSCEYMITDNGANAYYKDNLDLFYTDEVGNRYYPISCYGKERLHVFKKKQPSLGLFSDVDLMEYLNTRHFGLAKLSVYVEKDLDLILNQFRGLFKNYEVMATSKDYIEITKKDTNKWEAFCHLPVEDAIFIGDGENDLCILEKLKDTYVMEHAPESLKAYGVCVKSVAEAMNIESRKENV